MTRPAPDDDAAELAEATAGESEEESSRSRVVVLFVVGAVIAWRVVAAFPEVAYVVVGSLGTVGAQKVRAWRAKREEGDEADEEETPDVVDALQHLGRGGNSVLLTQLRKRLRVADTKAVKALLKDEGIRIRAGVRTSAGNGPGVHHEDIPAPPPEVESGHGEGCCCTSEPTTPTPTTGAEEGPGEGVAVEAIGQAGTLIRDRSAAQRRHTVK